jgi:hypothetical protein
MLACLGNDWAGVLREREEAVLRGVSAGSSPRSLGLGVGTGYRGRSGADVWEMSA